MSHAFRSDLFSTANRRFFLQTGAALAAAGLGWSQEKRGSSLLAEEAEADAAGLVAGKDPRLIVLERQPIVLETPVELLDRDGLTPPELLFVRDNQKLNGTTTIKPFPEEGWKIVLLTAPGAAPRTISLEQIRKLKERVSHEMVLQCSGNGRSLYNASAKVSGSDWGRGGMGLVQFAGVPVAAVLKQLQITLDPSMRFVTGEGKDAPTNKEPDFEHSLRIEDVLEKSLFALEMNGGPIPAIHGGPVRLVTPGFYGTMQIKWLSRLRFEPDESPTKHQRQRYRTLPHPIPPGTKIGYDIPGSTPHYGMKLKSTILSPAPNAKLPPGPVTVRGIAFNDGSARLEAVLISTDRGETWRPTTFTQPESPYAWVRFETKLELRAGPYEIWTRAVDLLGRTQPLDGAVHWNPSGYEWNGVEKIAVQVG